MNSQTLFARVVEDLQQRLQHPDDEYQIIRTSGLLRLLLLDEHPLLTVACPKVKARFEICPTPLNVAKSVSAHDEPKDAVFVGVKVAPTPGRPTVHLNLPEFLHATAGSSSWTGAFSVRQVIKTGSTAFGGIHFAVPRDPEEAAIGEVLRALDDEKLELMCRLLVEIGQVTATTCIKRRLAGKSTQQTSRRSNVRRPGREPAS
jgi:hypothetical protein